MELRTYFRRLWIYNDWANREALRSLQASTPPPASAVRRMGHLVGAEEIWAQRLLGESAIAEVWPELTLDACAERLDALKSIWLRVLDTLDDAPGGAVAYTSTKGVSYTNRVDDVMAHVIMHQAYHRGQIASDLRAQGDTPAVTDFIHYLREPPD